MEEEKIIKVLKLLSGKVLWTITASIAFLMVVYYCCQLLITMSPSITFDNLNSLFNTLILIISNIVTFYFTKESNEK